MGGWEDKELGWSDLNRHKGEEKYENLPYVKAQQKASSTEEALTNQGRQNSSTREQLPCADVHEEGHQSGHGGRRRPRVAQQWLFPLPKADPATAKSNLSGTETA